MRLSRTTTRIGIVALAASLLLASWSATFAQELIPPAGADLAAVSPAQPEIAFAAAGAIVLRSEDGGATWQEAGQLASPARSLAVTAGSPPVLLAGTASAGVFRSFDNGATWQAANEGLGLMPGTILEINALGADTEDPRIVYAATGYRLGTSTVRFTPAALLFSVDSGATWLPLAALPLNASRYSALAAVAGQPLTVQAIAGDGAATTYSVAAPALTALLEADDTSAARQASAARALGLLGDTQAVAALLTAAQSNDAQVANAAVEALGALQAERAVATLASLLSEPAVASPSVVADALAAIGTPEALAPLYAALNSDSITPERHAAMGALERLGSAAVPDLLELSGSESPVVQRNAVEMLGWIADPAATDALAAALQAADPTVRAQAAWALGETLASVSEADDAQLAAQLALAAAASTDLSPDVRLHATHALSRLPQQPLVAADSAAGAETATAASYAPVDERTGLRLPGWLAAAAPLLRWLILGLALAAIAVLPWLQGVRGDRRRRHN